MHKPSKASSIPLLLASKPVLATSAEPSKLASFPSIKSDSVSLSELVSLKSGVPSESLSNGVMGVCPEEVSQKSMIPSPSTSYITSGNL